MQFIIVRTARIKVILFIVFAAILGEVTATTPVNSVPDDVEFAVLKSLYDNQGGTGWTRKANWPLAGAWPASATSAQFGTWQGIKVENGDIVEINLNNNKLTGPLPTVIGNLQQLRLLTMYNNTEMGGTIPTSLTTIPTLQHLNLSNCGLTGTIPSALFNSQVLGILDLQANALTGGIPTNVGNATSLTMLSLTANRTLGGPIPASICSLANLKTLSLEICALTGVIPTDIGNLSNLEVLELFRNPLSGGMPTSISKLKKLTLLNLSENGLTGPIPTGISNLTNLEILRLNNNQLSASIPEIGNLTRLKELLLNNNALTGAIPASVVKLVKLQLLGLNNNKLTGGVPADIGNMVELLSVNLAANQLTGEIPASLGELKKLVRLGLGNNKLSGQIPAELGSASALTELYLYENKLTGSIPASLGNLSKLRTLFLHTNQLSGVIRPELSSLSRMEDFYLYNNRLEGPLPSDLFSSWTNLALVDVSNNQFTGQFPSVSGKDKLVRIMADRNAFGQLPDDILGLPVLASLSLKENEFKTIPLFCDQVNKGNLTVAMEKNQLDFPSLQKLTCVGLKAATFSPQRPFSNVVSINAVAGQPLVIPSAPAGPGTTTISWEKQLPDGSWQSVDGQNQHTTSETFKRNSYTAADEGVYRWRMTNSVVTGVTLESAPITVKTAIAFVLDNFAFQYKYDNRRRMTHKKVPGADWVYMVYDDRDRLVMTQDGEQRKTNNWLFTKYDAFNRPIMTGIYHHATALDQAGMSALISTTAFYETYTGSGTHHGYTDTVFPATSFPAEGFDIQTVTYYDNYDFSTGWGYNYAYAPGQIPAQTHAGYEYTQDAQRFTRVVGQVTGTKTKTTGSAPYWLYTVNYYDDKYRVIQQVSDNYKGGTDRMTTVYDFVGRPLASKTEHTASKLTWQNLTLTVADVDHLYKNSVSANWNAGASSAESIPAGSNESANGWVETTVGESTGNRMLGLSAQDLNVSYASIDYAFYVRNRELHIYQSGANVYTVPGGVAVGDRLRIERRGGYMAYYRNGIKVYPATATALPCTTALLTDVSIYTGRTPVFCNTQMSASQVNKQIVLRQFTYDHAGRLLTVRHTINGGPQVLLVKNEYNELGQLITKKLHSENAGSTFKQHEDFRYNIRGWLSRINQSDLTGEQPEDPQDLFGMNLSYNEVVPTLSNAPQFNGNISAITWNNGTGQGDAKQNGYRYSYDPMNRITGADYRQKKTDWAQPTHLDDEGDPHPSDAFSETGYQYDLNGNLTRLVRKGANGLNMDELTYSYGATDDQQSNRLLGVADAGDKHKGFNDGNTVGDDYVYDNNGSMVADKNKNIASITYNHLNLPIKVVKTTDEYIRYIYDASGRKHSQQVYDGSNRLTKRSDYSGEMFYENDTLKFINHEEGRIVMTGPAPEYQYHLKDHLGNVRVTFTSKDETETATATLEDANAATEQGQFLHYEEAVTLNEPLFDHTHHTPGNGNNTTFRSTRLLGGGDSTAMYGLARSFSVMPGDKITAKVYAKYVDSSDPQVQQALRDFLASLGAGNNGGPLLDGGGPGSLGGGIFPFTTFFNHQNETGDAPKAYLNYLVYDRDFNYLDGGFKPLTTNGRETGQTPGAPLPNGGFDVLSFEEGDIKITEPGFVYIYFSNENENRVEVFFDDFTATHTKSPVIQADDYYPFGLTFNSNRRENTKHQNFLYNGKEFINDQDLGWSDYGARMYDPYLGRWFTPDLLSELYYGNSPYHYALNNPCNFIDPNGMNAESTNDLIQNAWNKTPSNSTASFNSKGNCECGCPGKPPCKTPTQQEYVKYLKQFDDYKNSNEYKANARHAESQRQLVEGLTEAATGILIGAATEGLGEYIWIGGRWVYAAIRAKRAAQAAKIGTDYLKLFKPINEFDAVKTLYRGTTGSEATSSIMFLTDDAAVAASYVKNGGKVVQYTISEFALKSLRYSNELVESVGIHGAAGRVSTEFHFYGQKVIEALNKIAKVVE